MLRVIGGVILGYLALFLVIFVCFTVAYVGMGTERAFKPGSYEISALWFATSILVGLAGAIVGGFVAAAVARGTKAPQVLAGLLLVLGLLSAAFVLMSPDEGPRERGGDVGNFEAMQNAKQPPAAALLNPFIGAVGVLLGARLKRGARAA